MSPNTAKKQDQTTAKPWAAMDLDAIDRATAQFEIGTLRDAHDELDLRYGVWRGKKKPTRWIVFLNGRTEWIEKYSYLPVDLDLPDDCGFVTMDHRGQGASGGARAYVASYDQFASDAQRVIDHVTGSDPYVLFSHSMGGLVALHAFFSGFLRPQRMALCSPLLGLPARPLPRVVARPLTRLMSGLGLGTLRSGGGKFTKIPFADNRLTHHADLYERMQNSPYPVGSATFGWVNASFAATERCFDVAELARLDIPTLVLGGFEETAIEFAAFQRWVFAASQWAKAEVQLKLIPGAKHELLAELPSIYGPVMMTIRNWFAEFLT